MVLGAEEIGKTTRSFFDVLKDQPLSLALVIVILAMAFLLYFQTSQTLAQRAAMTDLIVQWQRDTDKLMANCVSQEVTKMMLENVQQVTTTMLSAAQKDIERMQNAIDRERETTRSLMERLVPRPQQQFFPQPKPIDFADCDPLGPYCAPPLP